MPELHPQFLTDPDGKPRSVLLPFDEYAALMDYLEDIEDVRRAEEALRKIESGDVTPSSASMSSCAMTWRSDLAR